MPPCWTYLPKAGFKDLHVQEISEFQNDNHDNLWLPPCTVFRGIEPGGRSARQETTWRNVLHGSGFVDPSFISHFHQRFAPTEQANNEAWWNSFSAKPKTGLTRIQTSAEFWELNSQDIHVWNHLDVGQKFASACALCCASIWSSTDITF